MDRAVDVPKINLLAARLSNVRAEVGEQSEASGGTIHVSVKTKLTDNGEPNQAVGQVLISVVAFPKGDNGKNKKSFVFKVDLAVDGIFEWAKGDRPNLKDDLIECLSLQSLYIMAVNEVVAIAQKLGFPGIELPLDLKVNKELSKKTPKKRSPAKAVSSRSKQK